MGRWHEIDFRDDGYRLTVEDQLHACATEGPAERLQWCLDQGVDVNHQDEAGRSALHAACIWQPALVGLLLHAGAKVRLPDGNGNTALHWACLNSNVGVLRSLLNHGALVDAANLHNLTPLCVAIFHGADNAMLRTLLEHGADGEAVCAMGDWTEAEASSIRYIRAWLSAHNKTHLLQTLPAAHRLAHPRARL